MQPELIVSVSGIRGIVGHSLTPRVVMEFAASYGSPLASQTIVVSRDGRTTGTMLHHAVLAGLLAVGCDVVDLGVAATPTCGFYIRDTRAAGGIQITASHNPLEWNGLKLFRPEGFVLSPAAGQKVADDYRAGQWELAEWDEVGEAWVEEDPHASHIARVLEVVDAEAIRARRFKVVLDANRGAGGTFGPRLLSALGCEFTVLGGVPDGRFEHPPEPTADNLANFLSFVPSTGAALGFAVDPDADRLALIDHQGRYVGEEYTLALAIRHRLASAPGAVVINSSTSRLSEDAARAAGGSVHRAKVGEVHVAERMLALQAVLGGEGNGGVIDPRVGMGRDSAIGMALILEMLAHTGASLAELVDSMPVYTIRKEKYPLGAENLRLTLDRIANEFADGTVDREDGLRVDWEDGWVQVRGSNTEPIVRVIAEAKDDARAQELCKKVARILCV